MISAGEKKILRYTTANLTTKLHFVQLHGTFVGQLLVAEQM
jgi:hypothetical protein